MAFKVTTISDKPRSPAQPFPIPTGRANSGGDSNLATTSAEREAILSKFARALGVQSSEDIVSKFAKARVQSSEESNLSGGVLNQKADSSDIIPQCISSTVDSHTVFCTLPSLDLNSTNEDDDVITANPLPDVGKTYLSSPMETDEKAVEEDAKYAEKKKKIPEMAASVIQPTSTKPVDAGKARAKLESVSSWTKSSVQYAGDAVAKNISASFSTLVDSRVRAWTLLLLRQSLNHGDASSRGRLLSMLTSSIEIQKTRTSFKTLPLPESARGLPNEYDVTLPMTFEAVINVKTGDNKLDDLKLRSPGTISANVDKGVPKPGLCMVDVQINCNTLLNGLVEQARLIVFKAVARATSVPGAGDSNAVAAAAAANPMNIIPHSGKASCIGLSTKITGMQLCSNANFLNEQFANEPSRLKKARSSALRLNKILEGKSYEVETNMNMDTQNELMKLGGAPLSKTRKTRSVRWNHPMESPTSEATKLPDPKRQRIVQSAARLRSTKSFGKPYAEDTGGPRNATFNEFGRKPVRSGPMWGRDGKLRYHPTATKTTEEEQNILLPPGGGSSNQNAIFDLQRPRVTSLHGLTRNNARRPDISASTATEGDNRKGDSHSGITRTATALENWLLNQTKRF